LIAKKLSDVLALIVTADSAEPKIDPGYEKIVDIDSLDSEMIPFLDKMCFIIRNTSIKASKIVHFLFKQTTKLNEAELFILDSNLVAARTLSEHNLHFLGPQMRVGMTDETKAFLYNIALTQTVYDEDDESKNCAVYPTSLYGSYGDCDKAYVESVLDGIVPIWATENISRVTTQYKTPNGKISMHGEAEVSRACKLPCTTTKGTFTLGTIIPYNSSLISVYFRDEMQVKLCNSARMFHGR
jgi:hypothetical protein